MSLNLDRSKFTDADAFYARLIKTVDSLDDDQAVTFLARLSMILANEVGDTDKLEAAIAAAKMGPGNGGSNDRGRCWNAGMGRMARVHRGRAATSGRCRSVDPGARQGHP